MILHWRPLQPSLGRHLSIPTSLTENESVALRSLAIDSEVLEIGSALGFSTILMASMAKKVVTIDHHLHIPNSLRQLKDNIQDHSLEDKVTVLIGDSSTVLATLTDQFDLAFVDGDHSALGVMADTKQVVRLVRPGGVLAFHDYGEDSCPEIAPVLNSMFIPFSVVDTLFLVRRN